jgi:hypothetical protein
MTINKAFLFDLFDDGTPSKRMSAMPEPLGGEKV